MQNCRILFFLNFLVFLVFCLLCSGCTPHTVTNHLAQAQSRIRLDSTQVTQDVLRANAIETALQDLDGVTQCSVLVTGQTAIIGLRTNADTLAAHQTLTAQAQELALQTDGQLRTISVTTNDMLVQRIEAYKATQGL